MVMLLRQRQGQEGPWLQNVGTSLCSRSTWEHLVASAPWWGLTALFTNGLFEPLPCISSTGLARNRTLRIGGTHLSVQLANLSRRCPNFSEKSLLFAVPAKANAPSL